MVCHAHDAHHDYIFAVSPQSTAFPFITSSLLTYSWLSWHVPNLKAMQSLVGNFFEQLRVREYM